jgi:hypothetical protein
MKQTIRDRFSDATQRVSCAIVSNMFPIRARVKNGRLLCDEQTGLSEGTVLDLVVDDEGDDLDEAERAALNQSISQARASLAGGRGRPIGDLISELKR